MFQNRRAGEQTRAYILLGALIMSAACRAPTPVPEETAPRESPAAIVSPPPAPDVHPPSPAPPSRPPAYSDSFASLHESRLEAFRLVHGLGDRMDPDVVLPYANTVDAGDAEPWKLTQPGYAMALVRPERGNVVITSTRDPFDFGFSSLPVRELDAFERDALARLAEGEERVVVKSPGKEVRMLGAIRAEEQCRTCHKTLEDGALMAAFSYRFTEMPDD